MRFLTSGIIIFIVSNLLEVSTIPYRRSVRSLNDACSNGTNLCTQDIEKLKAISLDFLNQTSNKKTDFAKNCTFLIQTFLQAISGLFNTNCNQGKPEIQVIISKSPDKNSTKKESKEKQVATITIKSVDDLTSDNCSNSECFSEEQISKNQSQPDKNFNENSKGHESKLKDSKFTKFPFLMPSGKSKTIAVPKISELGKPSNENNYTTISPDFYEPVTNPNLIFTQKSIQPKEGLKSDSLVFIPENSTLEAITPDLTQESLKDTNIENSEEPKSKSVISKKFNVFKPLKTLVKTKKPGSSEPDSNTSEVPSITLMQHGQNSGPSEFEIVDTMQQSEKEIPVFSSNKTFEPYDEIIEVTTEFPDILTKNEDIASPQTTNLESYEEFSEGNVEDPIQQNQNELPVSPSNESSEPYDETIEVTTEFPGTPTQNKDSSLPQTTNSESYEETISSEPHNYTSEAFSITSVQQGENSDPSEGNVEDPIQQNQNGIPVSFSNESSTFYDKIIEVTTEFPGILTENEDIASPQTTNLESYEEPSEGNVEDPMQQNQNELPVFPSNESSEPFLHETVEVTTEFPGTPTQNKDSSLPQTTNLESYEELSESNAEDPIQQNQNELPLSSSNESTESYDETIEVTTEYSDAKIQNEEIASPLNTYSEFNREPSEVKIQYPIQKDENKSSTSIPSNSSDSQSTYPENSKEFTEHSISYVVTDSPISPEFSSQALGGNKFTSSSEVGALSPIKIKPIPIKSKNENKPLTSNNPKQLSSVNTIESIPYLKSLIENPKNNSVFRCNCNLLDLLGERKESSSGERNDLPYYYIIIPNWTPNNQNNKAAQRAK